MLGSYDERITALNELVPAWEPMTIWGLFSKAVNRCPEADFLVYEDGRRYSYRRAMLESLKYAHALRDLGLRPGDHVAVKAANRPEAVLLGLALSGIRAVRVSLNQSLGSYELAYALRKSGARFLFTDAAVDFRGQDPVPTLECVVSASSLPMGHAPWSKGISAINWDSLLASPNNYEDSSSELMKDISPLCFAADDIERSALAYEVADIMFTSGSTGNPKGAMLTHDALLRSAYANCLNRGFEEGRRIFVPLPLSHVYAYVEGLLSALFVNGALLMSSDKLDAAASLTFVARERANDMLVVPSLMIKYLEHLEANPTPFPLLHAVYCSASSCPGWIWGAIFSRFGVDDVITGYGMTEVAGASLQTRPGDGSEVLASRVGTRLPAGCAGWPIAYRVVDPHTRQVKPDGEVGELECRGPIVSTAYVNDHKASWDAFSDDGWFRTGDEGRFDENGYLELTGRLKDSYKINGENVSTYFVEKVLSRHIGVQAVEAIGIPDERLGAVGAVFVQLVDDSAAARAAFESYCRQSLARYQVPKYYFFLSSEDWPRTALGKVEKSKLRVLVPVGAR